MIDRRRFLAGAAALVACSRPSSARAPAARAPAASTRTSPAIPWSPRPAPLADAFLRGVNFAHLHERGWGYGSDRARAQLDVLRGLGVRDVALNPFAYLPSKSSTELRWGGDRTLTDADIRTTAEDAHARGMRVMIKPHVWSRDYASGAGNMDLAPGDWDAWFRSYTRWAVHNAELARDAACEWLCVGLEFTSATLANPGAWARVADACRKVFAGKLVYAANWYEEAARFADWDAFDAVGIDAYFPLDGETVDELVASWAKHLDAIEAFAKGKSVIFPEAGYRAIAGAVHEPWDGRGGAPDPDLQARAYEALLRACTARPWFGGVYWWKWFTDPAGEGASWGDTEVDPFVPRDPARDVLAAWFRP